MGILDKVLRGVEQRALERYVPARGISERVADLISNPKVKRGLLARIDKGLLEGAGDWYNSSDLRGRFVDELGDAEGARRFKLYMDMVAAASPRSAVPANVRNASYYYKQTLDDALPEIGDKNPQPYGHMAQRLHQQNARSVAGEGWDALKNPKPASFVENLIGNELPVTVDTHATRLPAMLAKDPRWLATNVEEVGADGARVRMSPRKEFEQGSLSLSDAMDRPALWEPQPNKNEYAALETFYQELAAKKGVTPAQAQAGAWVGGGDLTGVKSMGGTFMDFFNQRVGETAKQTGKSANQVISDFINGKAPLLGIPLAAASAVLAQLEDEADQLEVDA